MERCEYFDNVAQQYSTEGCETVQLVDGGLACQCYHLSEFVSLKVPTDFEDSIQFANLDVPSEICLHCACTKGVELLLEKSDAPGATNAVLQEVDLRNLDVGYHVGAIAWRLHNITQVGQPTATAWVSLVRSEGRALDAGETSDTLQLTVSPAGLAETSAADSYAADVFVEVSRWIPSTERGMISIKRGAWENRVVPLPVRAIVRATVAANTSVWGEADSGACQHAGGTIVLHLGRLSKLPFTACDADSLPVNHQLPRPGARNVAGDERAFAARVTSFPAVATQASRGLTEPPVAVYLAAGRYELLVALSSGLGQYEISLELGQRCTEMRAGRWVSSGSCTEISGRQTVLVVCPPPMLPMPGNLSCGCEAGLEPTELGECVPCAAGHYKAHRSMDLCDPCEVGSFQPTTGQRKCSACARGAFQGSRGMAECSSCGPGTSSEAGAWRCTDCLPGSYATGGEPECLPCAPGSATDQEATAECTFCLDGWYAGVGFTKCRECGMFDQLQLTSGVPTGVECTGGVLNGSRAGYWAAQPLTLESANWTRVWKCQRDGACLGGADSACLDGYGGPLCDSCVEGYYLQKETCDACPEGSSGGSLAARAQLTLIAMCIAFCVGGALALALFKSTNLDQAINFFYRVRTNPIMALSQLWTKRHIANANKRKKEAHEASRALHTEGKERNDPNSCSSASPGVNSNSPGRSSNVTVQRTCNPPATPAEGQSCITAAASRAAGAAAGAAGAAGAVAGGAAVANVAALRRGGSTSVSNICSSDRNLKLGIPPGPPPQIAARLASADALRLQRLRTEDLYISAESSRNAKLQRARSHSARQNSAPAEDGSSQLAPSRPISSTARTVSLPTPVSCSRRLSSLLMPDEYESDEYDDLRADPPDEARLAGHRRRRRSVQSPGKNGNSQARQAAAAVAAAAATAAAAGVEPGSDPVDAFDEKKAVEVHREGSLMHGATFARLVAERVPSSGSAPSSSSGRVSMRRSSSSTLQQRQLQQRQEQLRQQSPTLLLPRSVEPQIPSQVEIGWSQAVHCTSLEGLSTSASELGLPPVMAEASSVSISQLHDEADESLREIERARSGMTAQGKRPSQKFGKAEAKAEAALVGARTRLEAAAEAQRAAAQRAALPPRSPPASPPAEIQSSREESPSVLEWELKGRGVVRVHLHGASDLKAAEITDKPASPKEDHHKPFGSLFEHRDAWDEHHNKNDRDTFCELALEGGYTFKSETIRQTLQPKWDEHFSFRGEGDSDERCCCRSRSMCMCMCMCIYAMQVHMRARTHTHARTQYICPGGPSRRCSRRL